MKYKFLEHTADVKFQAFGSSLKSVFENSALALRETMFGKIKISEDIKKKFEVEADDNPGLLYRFLEQFLYLLDAENFIFNRVIIKIKNNRLYAEVWGDLASNYKFTNDVKAITYNQMRVEKNGRKFMTQVVLDV